MKKLLLLAFALLIAIPSQGQYISVGNEMLKEKLSKLAFFNRKYYDKDIHFVAYYASYPDKVGVVREIGNVNWIDGLSFGCQVPQGTPFMTEGGYFMFALEFPTGCNTKYSNKIADNVFGSDLAFCISIRAYKADGSAHHRVVGFGVLRDVSANFEEFVYVPSCSKGAFFVSPKSGKRPDQYKWEFKTHEVTSLSGLIALDENRDQISAHGNTKISNGTYRIVNAKNPKICLEYDGEGLVTKNVDAAREGQKFAVKFNSGVNFQIAPLSAGGKVLTYNSASKKYKTSAIAMTNEKSKGQNWNFFAAPSKGCYYIVNRNGKCLDIEGEKLEPARNVGLYGNKGAANQTWVLVKADN